MKKTSFLGFRTLGFAFVMVLVLSMFVGCGEKVKEDGSLDLPNMNLKPYIDLGEYKGVPISYEIKRVTEEDVDEAFATFKGSLSSYVNYTMSPPSRPTMENDLLQLKYVGRADGEIVDDGSEESMYLLLSKENGYFEWLNQALYDVYAGETVFATGQLPDDENYGDLAGKTVTYELRVEAIVRHYTFQELTEELLFEKTGCRTEAEYREKLYKELDDARRAEASEAIYQTVWDKVLEASTVKKYPQKHVDYYYDSYYGYYAYYAAQSGQPAAALMAKEGKTVEDLKKASEVSTKEDLVYYAIVRAEGLEVTNEEYDANIEKYAKEQQMSVSELEEAYDKEYIRDCMLYDEVLAYLAEQANITYTYID